MLFVTKRAAILRAAVCCSLVLLVASLATLRSKRRSFLNMMTIYSQRAEELRKSGYFREMALGAAAARFDVAAPSSGCQPNQLPLSLRANQQLPACERTNT